MSKLELKSIKDLDFDEVEISLYHLQFLGNIIEANIKAFENIIGKVEDKDELPIWVSICSITIIQTISFLDEYNNFVKSKDPDLDTTIKAIKKTVKPALKKISEWRDLRKFRNNVLAHNLRSQKREASVFTFGLNSYDIPQTGADFVVLYNCISMIKDVFQSAFKVKLEKTQKRIDQFTYTRIQAHYKNGAEAKEVVENIRTEINLNIKNLKKETGV